MRDYELAEQTPQEYFDLASKKYDQAVKLVKELTFYQKKLNSGFSEPIALKEFDLILQCILIRSAVIDGEFHRLERQFIEKITDHADILGFLEHEIDLDISWDILEMMDAGMLMRVADILEKTVDDYADDFVEEFAKLDAFIEAEDYLSKLEECIRYIVTCLSGVDGKMYVEEFAAAEQQKEDILTKRWKRRKLQVKIGLERAELMENDDID